MCLFVFCSPLCGVNRVGRSPGNTCEQITQGEKGHWLCQQLGAVHPAAGGCPSTDMFIFNIGVLVREVTLNRKALNLP